MMTKRLRLFISIVLLQIFASSGLYAENSHWTFAPYDYQYYMTVYFTVAMNGVVLSDQSDFEVAAFCGDECRGVSKVLTAEKDGEATYYGYLRVRSNLTDGETIHFKVYQKSISQEYPVTDTAISFNAHDAVGLPSNPIIITVSLRGDANGDGLVTIADVTAIINKINNNVTGTFVETAADVNGDGLITIADVTGVINIINQ